MSYDQLSSLEAQSGGQGYSDDPGFKSLHQQLVRKIQTLRSNISKLAGDVNLLGTKRDTARHRERTNDLLEKSRNLCMEIGDGVKKLQSWEDLSKQQKYEQSRVSSEFQTALQEFQDIQRRALDREKASVTAAREAHAGEADPSSPGGGSDAPQQQQLQLQQEQLAQQDEVDFQESLIIQREEEIRAIEQGVGDLNVLFRQVGQIVNEQGDQIRTIADTVENVRDDTQGALRENRQAARYQKAARNKGCCLLIILTIIVAIVLLAIFLG